MLMREITNILEAPATARAEPATPLARLEYVLTSGYAHKLSLEAEQLRLERKLDEVARRVGSDSGARKEVSELVARIASAEGDLARLRALLEPLRDRAREARRAA
jgi:predicted RNase H-like nuclease (RuvC/YqgF family)